MQHFFLLLIFIFVNFILFLPIATEAEKNKSFDYKNSGQIISKSSVSIGNSLYRLDFRLEGKSCPVCLLSIQNKIRSLSGVEDAAVMLRRPFGVSVVYRGGKTTPQHILAVVKEKEPAARILDLHNAAIDKLPLPLIPPYMPTAQTAK